MKLPISIRSRRHILIAACLVSVLAFSPECSAKHVDKESDNSGRQIAAIIPGLPHTTITLPNLIPAPQKKPSAPIIQANGRTIKITVPKSVEEVADAAWVAGNKFAKASGQKVMEVWRWVAAWYRQNHSMPIATPAGSPYAQGPINHAHQLYFTNEGRLKTVVKQ